MYVLMLIISCVWYKILDTVPIKVSIISHINKLTKNTSKIVLMEAIKVLKVNKG